MPPMTKRSQVSTGLDLSSPTTGQQMHALLLIERLRKEAQTPAPSTTTNSHNNTDYSSRVQVADSYSQLHRSSSPRPGQQLTPCQQVRPGQQLWSPHQRDLHQQASPQRSPKECLSPSESQQTPRGSTSSYFSGSASPRSGCSSGTASPGARSLDRQPVGQIPSLGCGSPGSAARSPAGGVDTRAPVPVDAPRRPMPPVPQCQMSSRQSFRPPPAEGDRLSPGPRALRHPSRLSRQTSWGECRSTQQHAVQVAGYGSPKVLQQGSPPSPAAPISPARLVLRGHSGPERKLTQEPDGAPSAAEPNPHDAQTEWKTGPVPPVHPNEYTPEPQQNESVPSAPQSRPTPGFKPSALVLDEDSDALTALPLLPSPRGMMQCSPRMLTCTEETSRSTPSGNVPRGSLSRLHSLGEREDSGRPVLGATWPPQERSAPQGFGLGTASPRHQGRNMFPGPDSPLPPPHGINKVPRPVPSRTGSFSERTGAQRLGSLAQDIARAGSPQVDPRRSTPGPEGLGTLGTPKPSALAPQRPVPATTTDSWCDYKGAKGSGTPSFPQPGSNCVVLARASARAAPPSSGLPRLGESVVLVEQKGKKSNARKVVRALADVLEDKPLAGAGSLLAWSLKKINQRLGDLGKVNTANILLQEHRAIQESYSLGNVLGQGQFGLIRQATSKRTGSSFACKTISKASVKSKMQLEDIRRECKILEALQLQGNVCNLEEIFEDDQEVHLIMELCQGGDLFDRVKEIKRYTEVEAAPVMKTILEVLQSCHERSIVHRDIKLENVLLTSKESNTDVKVIDFGIAAFVNPGGKPLADVIGSLAYMAPEVFSGSYGCQADLWSAGVLMFVLLHGIPPFMAETETAMVAAIKGGPLRFSRSRPISPHAQDLISKLLTRNPQQRLTATEALRHPWISKQQLIRGDRVMPSMG